MEELFGCFQGLEGEGETYQGRGVQERNEEREERREARTEEESLCV